MGVWQGVAMDSLHFYSGPPCPTLRPADGPALKRPYGRFKGGPPARRAARGRLLPPWTPHAVRLRYLHIHIPRTSLRLHPGRNL
jgi:hypothetical protein